MSSATLTMRAPHEAIVITRRPRGYSVRRYYDPQTGQFINVDPAIDQTEVPYAYAADDPLDNSDPPGLFCIGPICTHSFDPSASLDAWINIGRGATFGLTDRIANWIVPGAACTVPQNSLDQFIGNAAASLLGGEALDAFLGSSRFGNVLSRLKAVNWADDTGSIGDGGLSIGDKAAGQMATRGWSEQSIEETVANPVETHEVWDYTSGVGREPATAYVNSEGAYVVVNDTSGQIVQISDATDSGWKPVWDDPRFRR